MLKLSLKSSIALFACASLAACGGGGGGGGGGETPEPTPEPDPSYTPGNIPSHLTWDPFYNGRWGWRGDGTNVGADGPRGTGVHAWGAEGEVSDFDDAEGHSMGRLYSGGSWSDDWLTHDPLGEIGARDAYAKGLTGAGVKVAVVDSRILGVHSDLDDNFFKNYDVSGGNGSTAAQDHGTHVAGIIAAERNGSGMHGVAYDAQIIGIAMGRVGADGLTFSYGDLAAATTSAVADGARIFNNSWGGETFAGNTGSALDNPTYRAAVADAIAQGSVFVWAAGNDYDAKQGLGDDNTSQEAKAALLYSELSGGFVNVVNLTWNGARYVISNSTGGSHSANSQICGVTKDYCLGAPGTLISSTVADGTYDRLSGTSMAAPTVSGGIAILFQAFPYVETEDILELLFTTATDLGDPGVDSIYGHGMMNLAAALAPVGSGSIPTTSSTTTNTGIAMTESFLVAEPKLQAAVSAATQEMVMLDDFDRAFVIGSMGLQSVQGASVADAFVVDAAMARDFEQISAFGSPVTAATMAAGAEALVANTVTLPWQEEGMSLTMNAVEKGDAAAAEVRLVSASQDLGNGWETTSSVGLLEERGQLFGNVGAGAYTLADSATTVSFGSSATRTLGEGVTFYAGLGLNSTDVRTDSSSLIEVSDVVSASGAVGIRFDLDSEDTPSAVSFQLGQDRYILDGEMTMRVPVGREAGGVILFDEVNMGAEALASLPELQVTYTRQVSEGEAFALSTSATTQEQVVSATWEREY